MTTTTCLRGCLVGLIVATALACDDSATSPTSIGLPPSLNLTGVWEVRIGQVQANMALRGSWNASQTGGSVTGPVTLSRAADNASLTGTFAGTLSGSRLSLRLTVPRGGIRDFTDCVISGTGTIEASATIMSGTLSTTYTNCEAFINQQASTDEVTFTKQ